MDPKATLSAMLDALDDNDFGTARADLESLIEWRSKGGYIPSDRF